MFLLRQGGCVMWPLLFLSLCSCTLIIERWLFYTSIRSFKNLDIENKIFEMSIALGREWNDQHKENFFLELCNLLPDIPLFKTFYEAILRPDNSAIQKVLLQNTGQDIVRSLDNRLEFIAIIAKISPLLGLLGTVIGMIDTFSKLENVRGGIDMEILAGGIWQALLTTAVGLVIAILSWFAFQIFTRYSKNIAAKLEHIARFAFVVHFPSHSIE